MARRRSLMAQAMQKAGVDHLVAHASFFSGGPVHWLSDWATTYEALLAGTALTLYLSHAGFTYPGMEEWAVKFNMPSRMYPELSFLSLSIGPLVVFAGALLAALYPALRLFRLQPVAAMRAA